MKLYILFERLFNKFGYTILRIEEYQRLSNNSFELAKVKHAGIKKIIGTKIYF